MTVVFADLVGSTARAEKLDPEDVRAVLSPFHASLRHELSAMGERWRSSSATRSSASSEHGRHEDDPERAVRAALAIQEAITEMNEADPTLALEVRIGVNTGVVLVALDARPESARGSSPVTS